MASRPYSLSLLAAVFCAAASPSLADDTPLFERSLSGAWVQTTPLLSPMRWSFSVNDLGALGETAWPAPARWPDEAARPGERLDAVVSKSSPSLADAALAEDQPRIFVRVAYGEWDALRRAAAQPSWNFSVDDLGAVGAAAWRSERLDVIETPAIPKRHRAAFAAVYDAGWSDVFAPREPLSAAERARFATVFDAFWAERTFERATPTTAYAPSITRGGATPATAYAPSITRGGATPATAYAPTERVFDRTASIEAYGPPAPAAGPEMLDFSFGGLHLGAIFNGGWLADAVDRGPAHGVGGELWGDDGSRASRSISTSTIPDEGEWGLD